MNEFWTADTHLGHKNIIQYSHRPFSSVEEMDEVLIQNINSVVKSNDILYHLGDFAFGRMSHIISYLQRLNCKRIRLVLGNHDKEIKRKLAEAKPFFEWIEPFGRDIKTLNGQRVTLCHYCMRIWNGSHYGSWHCWGHSHGSLPDNKNALSWDVGVDNNKYMPVAYEELKLIMSKKEWQPIDHHSRKDME